MKRYNAKDFEVGDEVAVWGRSDLPTKHVVEKSNTKFFTTDKGAKFNHSTWDEWGGSRYYFSLRAERWDEVDYQQRSTEKQANDRRKKLLNELKDLRFDAIDDNDDLQHVLDFCSTMIKDWDEVRQAREEEHEFQRRRSDQIDAIAVGNSEGE